MKKILALTIFFFAIAATSQNIYINQNGVEISKKEFRKSKRKGSDSLIAISSYDQEINELFLKRKTAKITNAKDEIIAINQITGNQFDTETPLLVLYYPSIEEATLVRDEILHSKHWYTSQYSVILRNIKKNLGNTLIVAASNSDGIELTGIYNDDLQYFHLTYFNSTVATPFFLWISEENSFTEPVDFFQNYAVINTKEYLRITKYNSPDSLITVDRNLRKINLSTFSKPVKRIEYLNLNEKEIYKVIHENQRKRKIDTTIRNTYADYFSDLIGKTIQRNDTIILDFNLYTDNYEGFNYENENRKQLHNEIDEDDIKLIWIAQAGSLYVPDGCFYDYKDAIRKVIAFEGPTVGKHYVLYPDGTLLSSNNEYYATINLKLIKNGNWGIERRTKRKMSIPIFLLSKQEIQPPKVFDPTK